jgi:hypothetical protein
LNTAHPDPDPIEILSAFLDGEAVDPKRLAEALTAPGAREALRDFALIRAEVLADESRPSPAFYETMGSLLGETAGDQLREEHTTPSPLEAQGARPRSRGRRAAPSPSDAPGARPRSREENAAPPRRQRWWAAAVPVPAPALAALAVLFVALGLWAWRPLGGRGSPASDTPPAADRVVEFRPGVDWKSEPGSSGVTTITR